MEITFYGKENCPKCENAKSFLKSKEVDYKLLVIGKDIDRDFFLELYPDAKTVPFFVIAEMTFNNVHTAYEYYLKVSIKGELEF